MSRPALALAGDGFFAHHGLWAPGVRVFRRLGFRAKALIVSGCFLLPLAIVATGWFTKMSGDLDFTRQELAGTRYLQDLAAAQTALLDLRRLAQAPDAAAHATQRRQLGERWAVWSPSPAPGEPALVEAAAIDGLRQALSAAGHGPAALAAHDALIDQYLAAVGQVLDSSNLALDPELASYYLMDATLLRLPALADQLQRLALHAQRDGAQALSTRSADLLIETQLAQLRSGLTKIEPHLPTLKQRTRLDEVLADIARTRALASQPEQAAGVLPAATAAITRLAEAQQVMTAELATLLDARATTLANTRLAVGVAMLLSLGMAMYLFHCFFLVMSGGLKETRRHLLAMSHGDLTTSPSPWGCDEAAELMNDLRDMQEALRQMVTRMHLASRDIVDSSATFASGMRDLSQRSEHSAESLQQSAAAMEQIAVTVRHTASHTDEVARLARDNADAATDGGRVMDEVVETMEGIRSASSRIGDIIATIDGIAFQTNILALNAAVEAARAGEQGRGFAVVAGEVRALAQRSAQAAREIKSLIGASVDQVEAGTVLAQEAGSAIADIVREAERVNALIGEISSTSGEQSRGFEQINQAMGQLDQNTQQNAAAVEETAAAAESLRRQTQSLVEAVHGFKLADA